MSKHDDDTCPHIVRASLLEAEVARLKAFSDEAQAHIAKQETKRCEMTDTEDTENARLWAEVERLRKVANNYLDVCDKYALFRCDEERLMARVLALELRTAAKEGKSV